MLNWLLVAMLASAHQEATSWRPPEAPDPGTILHEANRDAREGRHDVALEKFLWYHHNALTHDQAQAGVRLSFALSYWLDLGRVYPPALEALARTGNDALEDFGRDPRGRGAVQAFSDFAAINKTLDQESRTAGVFEKLDKAQPDVAEQVFGWARPSLIRAKKYQLCGKYLRPEEDWMSAAQLYHMGRRDADRFGPEHTEYVKKAFTNKVATLVALLVVNGRKQDAERIAQKAQLEWESQDFQAAIASALGGVVPDAWP